MITSLPVEITKEIKTGAKLVGDDYSPEQIARWYFEEKEAFFSFDNGNSINDPHDAYLRSLTCKLAATAIHRDDSLQRTILVLGPGTGLEMDSILQYDKFLKIIFIEASENFRSNLLVKFPKSTILSPKESGELSLESNSVDLILALSVLHHIPNVSFLIQEFARVLKSDGYAIIREPCSSMGDWRIPRGLTPNERGIPKSWMLRTAKNFQLKPVRRPVPVIFNPLSRLIKKLKCGWLMSTKVYFFLDIFASQLVACNDHYWRDAWYKKIGPSAYFYVFRKQPIN